MPFAASHQRPTPLIAAANEHLLTAYHLNSSGRRRPRDGGLSRFPPVIEKSQQKYSQYKGVGQVDRAEALSQILLVQGFDLLQVLLEQWDEAVG